VELVQKEKKVKMKLFVFVAVALFLLASEGLAVLRYKHVY
jgi:hypothetical protein